MTIDALPTAPNRNMTPEAFVAAADAFVSALPTFASQVNADLNAILTVSGLLATSSTSLAIGVGAKSLTIEAGKAFLTNQSVRIYSTAAPTNYMLGTVTSYDAVTGALVADVASVGGSGTVAAWTVVLSASGEWVGNATSATSSNRVDSGLVTIASHATTADIFAAAANTIDWTGTATTTAFPAAPKAGMVRTLYCAGSCAFTAGADLLIEGVASGTTVTMAAGAIVNVLAVTTTRFKITYSTSGTFTITATGFTVDQTVTANWAASNGVVTLHIPVISGTSNFPVFNLSGIPAQIRPTSNRVFLCARTDNSSDYDIGDLTMYTDGTAQAHKLLSSPSWTSSGTKALYDQVFTYTIG